MDSIESPFDCRICRILKIWTPTRVPQVAPCSENRKSPIMTLKDCYLWVLNPTVQQRAERGSWGERANCLARVGDSKGARAVVAPRLESEREESLLPHNNF